jgi:hypothetical protein
VESGDFLIAVDQYDTSTAPAKITQRIIASQSWPIILVFEKRPTKDDAFVAEASISKRSYDLDILYPPSLTTKSSLGILLAEWTTEFSIYNQKNGTAISHNSGGNICPIFILSTAKDFVGCEIKENEFTLPRALKSLGSNGLDGLDGSDGTSEDNETNSTNGDNETADVHIDIGHPMISMLLQESQDVSIPLRSMAIMKRGINTYIYIHICNYIDTYSYIYSYIYVYIYIYIYT